MIRTLVVDDDFRVAEVHREYLERVKGFSLAGQAHTGAEALQIVGGIAIKLIRHALS